MKRLALLFLIAICLCACGPKEVAKEKKAILILIDGVPADVLESVVTPNIDAIAAEGGYAHAYQGGAKGEYSQTPTISAPGYMNMITGVWGNKHNVWCNSVRNPNYNYWNVFRIAETLQPELKTAIFSTWLDNRTKLVGESKPEAGGLKLDYAFDGFELDTVAFPHGNDRTYIYRIDERVSKEAARYIKAGAPDVSWVYLEYTDDIGHAYGDGPEMIDAVQKADVQIGRIWDAIQYREANYNEDWVVTITTDHGRHASNGKGHGGQSDRERLTWIATNQQDLNERFNNGLAVVDILPSVLRHLDLELPTNLKSELDGVPYSGEISFHSAKAELINNEIKISWEPVQEGKLELLMTQTNDFATGGNDEYESLGFVTIQDGQFSLSVEPDTVTYKLLLKAEYNWSNTWYQPKDKEE